MISPSHFHPMLVHFPIALVVVGFLADLSSFYFKKEACLSKMGFYLLLLGTASAIFAWLTGQLFTSEMSGAAGEVKEIHEIFAITTLALLLVTSALRIYITAKNIENRNMSKMVFILYALAAISVSITGYFGGNLVYNYMMPL